MEWTAKPKTLAPHEREMLRVTAHTPPAALLLVHGAGSGPWIWRDWPPSFPGTTAHAIDLHAGLDVARASHADYAASLVSAAATLPQPLALCGWSMGGLVVMQASAAADAHGVILIEASPPLEIQGGDTTIQPRPGTFDPEEAYGPFPNGERARPESSLARAERKRGTSVPSLPCPSLVIYGDEFREERGLSIARRYQSAELYFPGLNHWQLITDGRVRQAVAAFLGLPRSTTPGRQST